MLLEGVAAIVVALVSLVLYTLSVHYLENARFPPGPLPLPLVGNMFDMGSTPHISLTELSKKYGDIFRLKVGIHRIVVVNSIELAWDALVRRSNDFAGRPMLHTASLISRKGTSIAFGGFDDTWKKQRKIAHSAIKMYSTGETPLETKICREVDELVRIFSLNEGNAYNPDHDVRLAMLNIICSFVFGTRYEMDDPEFLRVIRYTEGFVKGFGAGNLVDYFPWLRFFPNKRLSLIKEAIQERDTILQRKYQEHYDTYRDDVIRDYTDALLKEHKNLASSLAFTEDNSIMAMSDVFSAGLETVSSSLLWMLLYLVGNPNVQEKAHQELDRVIGHDRMAGLHDRSNLPYVEATIAEMMRYSSSVPLLFPHSTTVDTSLKGYAIPKGTVVLFNAWAMHHDPDKWANPDHFDPGRFLDSEGKFICPASLSYLPFSAGRRVCLAETIAKKQLFLFVSRLLQKFNFSLPAGKASPDLEAIFGASLEPKPFKIVIHKRN